MHDRTTMNDNSTTIHSPIIKVILAWVGAITGLPTPSTWGELAALLAAIYTALMILEFVWRKMVLPVFKAGKEELDQHDDSKS